MSRQMRKYSNSRCAHTSRRLVETGALSGLIFIAGSSGKIGCNLEELALTRESSCSGVPIVLACSLIIMTEVYLYRTRPLIRLDVSRREVVGKTLPSPSVARIIERKKRM